MNHDRSNTTDFTGKPIVSIAVAKRGLDLIPLVACHTLRHLYVYFYLYNCSTECDY